MTRFRLSVPGRHNFLRGMAAKILLQTTFVVALIEAVFLAEKFSAIFDQGVDKHASGPEIALVLLCAGPEILDLALALAIMVGVYRVLLAAREDRELLVMAGAGMGTRKLLGILLGIAILTQAGSLLISGVVAPAAEYAQRVILFNAQYRALRKGISTAEFYYFPNHVVFVGPRQPGSTTRHLFIREKIDNTDRVITANQATLDGPDANGMISLHLRDFLAYDFDNGAPDSASATPTCPGCPALPANAPAVTMRVRNFTQRLGVEQLFRFDPRGTSADEWTLPELLGLAPPPTPPTPPEEKSLGQRIARSLIALLAPLLAAVAVIFTTRTTQTVTLPAACVALLGLDVVASMAVDALSPFGTFALLAALIAATLVLLGLLIARIARSPYAIVRPALTRP